MHDVTLIDAPPAAAALAALLGSISERCYCASWLDGIEFVAWQWVVGGEEDPEFGGGGDVTHDEVAQLRALSTVCDGWVAWRDVEHGDPIEAYLSSGPYYVPMAEWLQRVAAKEDAEKEQKRLRAILMNA
jgi:hypothetical protein